MEIVLTAARSVILGTASAAQNVGAHPLAGLVPWQCFHLRPLPQGQGSLRPRRESWVA
jgi:hypothetical protein